MSEPASCVHKWEARQSIRTHAQKGLVFGLKLCCCHLEILNNVLTKSSTFSFCTGPSKYLADPAGDLKQQDERGNCKEFHIAGAQTGELGVGKGESREGPGILGWGQITAELYMLRSRNFIPWARSRQTPAPANLACLLSWYSLQAKNSFYVF